MFSSEADVHGNETLSAPSVAELRDRAATMPWRVEGVLAGAGAVALAVGGFSASTAELATLLSVVSLGGLVVLLVAEARSRRKWSRR